MKFKLKFMQRLVSQMPVTVAVAIHWTMQSMLYADPTERRFKLFLDALLTATGGLIFSRWWPKPIAWPAAFLLAHTLNFLSNAQLCALLKNYGFISHNYEEFEEYVQQLRKRAEREHSLRSTVIYGSLSRQAWSPSSDLDLRIIRHPGFINGVRSCWFLLRERTRALINGFPLDAYVLDSTDSLKKLRSDEKAIYLSGEKLAF
jgi:predicted nucleotidyltransferase